jgi:inhibitor of cysteine peptidase
MKKLILPLIAACALIVVVVLVGFARSAPQTKEYGKDNTSISVGSGNTFVIKLDENPSTGYTWKYAVKNPTLVVLKSDQYVPDDASGKLVGSGGKRILTFQTVGKGSTQIECNYQRPWESVPPNQLLVFTVTVV